jgi:hypothetical protein
MVTMVVELTDSQWQLLRFFADRGREPRSVRPRTYAALISQGLIQSDVGSPGYRITELGRRTVTRLEQAHGLTDNRPK